MPGKIIKQIFSIHLDLDDEDNPTCYGMEQVATAKFRLEELCEHCKGLFGRGRVFPYPTGWCLGEVEGSLKNEDY
jgi:hypothetical protein